MYELFLFLLVLLFRWLSDCMKIVLGITTVEGETAGKLLYDRMILYWRQAYQLVDMALLGGLDADFQRAKKYAFCFFVDGLWFIGVLVYWMSTRFSLPELCLA